MKICSGQIERFQEYLDRDKSSAKLYTIRISPASDPSELKALGDKVAILRAMDCINGIPNIFRRP